MLKAEIIGLTYCRVLSKSATMDLLKSLTENFDYVFIVRYASWSSPLFNIIKKQSAVINLSSSLDEVFKNFHSTCRNEIRRSFKEAKLEFIDRIQDFDEFYGFHKACEQERNWKPMPKSELVNSLSFAVKYNGIFMAGMTCYHEGDFMRIGRIFSKRRAKEFENLPGIVFSAASRRIIYEYCRWGIANKKTMLDLGGVDPNDETKKGITRFKMYFGSKLVDTYLGRFQSERLVQKKNNIDLLNIDIT
jgi:hypothetical protein